MDYRELLKKYINIVGNAEGVSFIEHQWKNAGLSDEEWEELKILDKESEEVN